MKRTERKEIQHEPRAPQFEEASVMDREVDMT